MDRSQIIATGLSLGTSTVLLVLGAGLVCDTRARDAESRAEAQALSRVAAIRADHALRTERSEREAQIASLRDRVRAQEVQAAGSRRAALERLAREEEADLARLVRAWDAAAAANQHRAPREVAQAALEEAQLAEASDAEFASVREAALSGDAGKIREAVALHNARGGTPVYLHDDPMLETRGVSLRARYDRGNPTFAVVLEAKGGASADPCAVLVAPGSIVKAASGYQDTAPIQARLLRVRPNAQTEQTTTIACAQIHSQDPRSTLPRGVVRHADPRVALVAATAEREQASWGAAQVALWAVANDATATEVVNAPGSYGMYIDPAREVLEKAGIDTNKLPLYTGSTPRGRRGAFGIDGRVRLMGG